MTRNSFYLIYPPETDLSHQSLEPTRTYANKRMWCSASTLFVNFYNQNIEVDTIETDTSKTLSSKLRDMQNRMKPSKPACNSPSRRETMTMLDEAVGNSQTLETQSPQCYVQYRMRQITSSGGNRMRKETARTGIVLCEGYYSGDYEFMSKMSVEFLSHIYIVDVRDFLFFFSKMHHSLIQQFW